MPSSRDETSAGRDKAIAAPFNVTHKQDIEAAVEHIEKDIGVIDVLINNAGISAVIRLLSFPNRVE